MFTAAAGAVRADSVAWVSNPELAAQRLSSCDEYVPLRIALIASSLEPQRDGVGDYTRALADELRRLGAETALCALNDRHLATTAEMPREIRFAARSAWNERLKWARKWLDDANADWVSLQFVCYGYQSRGLCWSAVERLRRIIAGRPVHLMLHELWIGAGYAASWKDRLVGAMQRKCVLRLFQRLNVRCTHVSNSGYAARLVSEGIKPKLLPLFGSVPILAPAEPRRSDGSLRVLMFGAVYPNWSPTLLMAQLEQSRRRIEISHVGHIGPGKEWWLKTAQQFGGRISFRLLGPKSPDELAGIFAAADVGLTSNSWEIVGKSAAVAAMLEHGLPVIVARDEVHYEGWTADGYDPLLIKLGSDLARRLCQLERRPSKSHRTEVAARMLGDIQATLISDARLNDVR